ncbi:MAG: SDR family NAD(P)-dependent oxidoreductase, partial [Chloroflexales bacterium]|nr:SDR family NAD(P)-dependent oxidoreductase [Chloroflexales bacterium]
MSQPVVLLTGASAGVGRATAELLSGSGFRVFGTSRAACPDPALPYTLLPLDVRSDESAAACVRAVLEQAGRLDVLINNAGHGLSGALEEASIAQARALFETNFFGAVRMVNQVLPIMRGQRGGIIVNVSSLVGLTGMPFEGFYAASKHALEGYSETLRLELSAFNIRVALVEPGGVRTSFGRALQPVARPIDDYAILGSHGAAYFIGSVESGIDPRLVAWTILRILRAREPRLRYLVGADARLISFGKRLLPDAWRQAILRWQFRLGRRPPSAPAAFA